METKPILVKSDRAYLVACHVTGGDNGEQMVPVSFFVNGHRVAERTLRMHHIEEWKSCGLFNTPRQVGILGAEEEGNLVMHVVAVRRVDTEEPEASWETEEDPTEPRALKCVSLGIVRWTRAERAHPDNLEAELLTVFSQVFRLERNLTFEQQAVENLLASV
jgi:hypothetical protein